MSVKNYSCEVCASRSECLTEITTTKQLDHRCKGFKRRIIKTEDIDLNEYELIYEDASRTFIVYRFQVPQIPRNHSPVVANASKQAVIAFILNEEMAEYEKRHKDEPDSIFAPFDTESIEQE